MSIKRFMINQDGDIYERPTGDMVRYCDHLAALTAQHKVDMEFAEWISSNDAYIPGTNRGTETMEYYFDYWLKNVRAK